MEKTKMVVVVTQLVERLLPKMEVLGSDPIIGKFYITNTLSTVLKRQKEKKKRPGMAY